MNKPELPGPKKILFWMILILIPVIFFVSLELLLRAFEYGAIPDLVIKTKVHGKEYYTLNRSVATRYFTQKGISVPEVFDDLFEIEKKPDTKRIFMLGESTMAGFPFDYNATPPRLLQDRLRSAFPNMNIEVVNVGLSAVNSYTVLDFMRELVNYEPDAFVIYLGHNEFYGAFGIGSTQYLGQWRGFVNLYLRLQHVRTFVLLRDGLNWMTGIFSKSPTPYDATLMEAMVRERTITFKSDEYNIAKENFRDNLGDIISIAQKSGTPVVVSTLTSNVRDQKPLVPVFSPVTSESDRKLWQDLMERGWDLIRSKNFKEALRMFKAAINIDTMNAEAYFRAANCCDSLGEFEEAYDLYSFARDNDELRFRATREFNELIRELAGKQSIPVADAERAFEDASPNRLVGRNLMMEHLHPTFDGYFLLAKTFYETMKSNNLMMDPAQWADAREIPEAELKSLSGVTELTLETANIRIYSLVQRWPFKPAGLKPPDFIPATETQNVALDYVNKRVVWSSAHMKMAEWYRSKNEYQKAYNEYYAISKVAWYSYQPLMNMGDIGRLMKNSHAAESLYLKANSIDPSPFVSVRLGMLYYDLDSLQKSIDKFEEGLRAEVSAREQFKPKDRSMARYFLAVVYGKKGNILKAR